jgi:hypothetical protein
LYRFKVHCKLRLERPGSASSSGIKLERD